MTVWPFFFFLLIATATTLQLQLHNPNADSAKDIILYTLNGILEAEDLEDASKIVACYDSDWAEKIVKFTSETFHKLAQSSASGLPAIEEEILKFTNQTPKQTVECIVKNEKVIEMSKIYGIKSSQDIQTAFEKVNQFAKSKFITFRKWAKEFDQLGVVEGNYYVCGSLFAQRAKIVLGLSLKKQTIQTE